MVTSIEVFDDPVKAHARVEDLRRAGGLNPRFLEAKRISVFDRRGTPQEPVSWIREDAAKTLWVVQYERAID